MKRKIFTLLTLLLCLVFCFISCDDETESSTQSESQSESQSQTQGESSSESESQSEIESESETESESATESESESETETEAETDTNDVVSVTGIKIVDYVGKELTSASIYNLDTTLTLYASITPTNATDKSVKWESSNPEMASIDQNGVVNPHKHGKVTITATASNGSKASCELILGANTPITSIEISSYDKEIFVSKTSTFSITAEPFGTSESGLIWSSSDESVATVAPHSETSSNWAVVTGVSAGEATITVTAPSGVSASVTITVKQADAIPVELYVNGELWKTVYTSAIENYRIKLDELDPEDITTNEKSTQYFERWYKTSNFSGLAVDKWEAYKTPSKLYAKMTNIDISAFKYTESNGSITITGYDGDVPATLVIPSLIDDIPVRAIDKFAFRNISTIKTVYICEGIETIGMQAFIGCSNMYSVSIPNSIEEIGYYAFPYTRLSPANYGTCNYVGNEENPFLVAVSSDSISDGYVVLHKDCKLFLRDASKDTIKTFMFEEAGAKYLSIDDNGVLYNKDKTTLVLMPARKTGNYELPASVTEIKLGAFENSSLNSVSVEEGSTSFTIKDGILYNSELTEIVFVPSGVGGALEIPATVTSVDYFAFSRALYVTEITFLGNITSLDKMGFGNCTMLEKITIENSEIYETRDGIVYEKGSNTAYITPRAKQ